MSLPSAFPPRGPLLGVDMNRDRALWMCRIHMLFLVLILVPLK
jgi:hypothetical protein